MVIHFLEAFVAVQDISNDLVRSSRKFIIDSIYLGPVNLVCNKKSIYIMFVDVLRKLIMWAFLYRRENICDELCTSSVSGLMFFLAQ